MWRRQSASVQFAGVVLVLVLAACTEPQPQIASPDALVGEFALALPWLEVSSPGFSRMIVADTFAFDGYGHFSEHIFEESLTDSTQSTHSRLVTGDYLLSADTVDLTYYCEPGAACVPSPRGFLQPTGDLLLVYSFGLSQKSRYGRVR